MRKNTVVGFVKPKCLLTPVIISHPVLRAKKAQKTIQLYSNQAESQRKKFNSNGNSLELGCIKGAAPKHSGDAPNPQSFSI